MKHQLWKFVKKYKQHLKLRLTFIGKNKLWMKHKFFILVYTIYLDALKYMFFAYTWTLKFLLILVMFSFSLFVYTF